MSTSFFFQADDGIRYGHVTGVQTCALPILAFTSRKLRPKPAPPLSPRLHNLPATPPPASMSRWVIWNQVRVLPPLSPTDRSEERRVGKEGKSRNRCEH